jgi:hypothetical protein
VGAAALPGGAREGGADRLDQPGVSVAGDQRDPEQTTRGEVAEETEPPGAVLGGNL